MRNRLLIIGNWKCNPQTIKEAEQLFNAAKKGLKGVKNAEVVICPPFVYLESGIRNQESGIKFGGQDLFWEQSGAYTGEVSGTMLKDLGCQYVIVGHSERRKYFSETDEMVNKKLKAALKAKLNPVLCIGEKEEEEIGVIKTQLTNGLKGINRARIKDVIIAYEPVWAIGTGDPCGPNDAMGAALFIRKILGKLYSINVARKIRVLYGGSVTSRNAKDYVKGAGMDGLLVGGASLDAKEFVNIVKQVSKNA